MFNVLADSSKYRKYLIYSEENKCFTLQCITLTSLEWLRFLPLKNIAIQINVDLLSPVILKFLKDQGLTAIEFKTLEYDKNFEIVLFK